MKLKLCDSETAYQVTPDKEAAINLVKERNKLDSIGTILAVTPYVAVIRTPGGVEFSLYSSGKILFKKLLDEKKTREIAGKVYSVFSLSAF
ncbi:MAG: hypothetical protein V1820_03925 [archaeon]